MVPTVNTFKLILVLTALHGQPREFADKRVFATRVACERAAADMKPTLVEWGNRVTWRCIPELVIVE